jgi:hypothetical protein
MEEILEKILMLKEILSLIDTSDDEHEEEPEPEPPELELVYDSELDDIDDSCYRKRKWRRT